MQNNFRYNIQRFSGTTQKTVDGYIIIYYNMYVGFSYDIAEGSNYDMKKTTLKAVAFLLFAAVLTVLPAGCGRSESGTAGKEEYADCRYEYIEESDSFRITGLADTSLKELTIPETIEGKPVTEIGDDAFRSCSRQPLST